MRARKMLRFKNEFRVELPITLGDVIEEYKSMQNPKQSPPLVRRKLIEPHTTMDTEYGRVDDLFRLRMDLMHGANYNDPGPFDEAAVKRQGSTCCQRCSLEATGVII